MPPPPLPPPPAEASVGMSAAAPMAATVATAKIVLRIMGLSWFLMDVLSHSACQSGERSVGFNGASIKNDRQIVGQKEGPRISLREAGVFRPIRAAASPLVAVWLAPQGRARSRASLSRLAALRHGRYKPPRSALLRFPP